MYNFNAPQLPAPYELPQNNMSMYQASQSMQQPQSFARGGHAKSKKMVIAHVNPKELDALDHLQGNKERCPKTGLRCYSHLEELIKNPHIAEAIHTHARRHRSEGGSTYGTPELEHLAEGGRNGDNELALIGPHTHHMLNQLAGHPTNNPHTGHPEYFSLGSFLGGLWNKVKGWGQAAAPHLQGIAAAAAPQLAQMGQQYLGQKFGNEGAMGKVGQMAGAMLPVALNRLTSGGAQSPFHTAAGQGLGRGLQAYNGGATGAQALGQGIQHAGQQFNGSRLGGAMQGVGSALNQGQGLGGVLKGGLGGLAGMMRQTSPVAQRSPLYPDDAAMANAQRG